VSTAEAGIAAAPLIWVRWFHFIGITAVILPSLTLAQTKTGTEIVREMNRARQQPAEYATYLEEMRVHFNRDLLILPDGTRLRTHEGVAAVNGAIRFLRRTQPLSPLAFSQGMSLGAAEHVAEQQSGRFGHAGSDGTNPGERMNRHGVWSGGWGENISYGESNPRNIVIALIIDDGQRARKHRKNIFNPDFHFAGAAVGPHVRYRSVCSIDFASDYLEARPANRELVARN
jgi:uncharacterized protein YkwD